MSYGYTTKETSVKLHSVQSSKTAICGQPCTMYDVPTMTLRIVHIVRHGPQNNRRMQCKLLILKRFRFCALILINNFIAIVPKIRVLKSNLH